MKYENFTISIRYDEPNDLLIARVVESTDEVEARGKCVEEVKQGIIQAVDAYLVECKRQGKAPGRRFSGKFWVRLDPQVHKRLFQQAERRRLSMNQLFNDLIEAGLKAAEAEMEQKEKSSG